METLSVSLADAQTAGECMGAGTPCPTTTPTPTPTPSPTPTPFGQEACESGGGTWNFSNNTCDGGAAGCVDYICPIRTCQGGSVLDTCSCRCLPPSPIVLDVAGNGLALTDAAGGVPFDLNADGALEQLSWIWQDLNHNGVSEAGELHSLPALGLQAVDLDYRESGRVDRHGNRFRYRAKVRDAGGAQLGRWAWDVFLLSGARL